MEITSIKEIKEDVKSSDWSSPQIQSEVFELTNRRNKFINEELKENKEDKQEIEYDFTSPQFYKTRLNNNLFQYSR